MTKKYNVSFEKESCQVEQLREVAFNMAKSMLSANVKVLVIIEVLSEFFKKTFKDMIYHSDKSRHIAYSVFKKARKELNKQEEDYHLL
jgi:hypothetical protein